MPKYEGTVEFWLKNGSCDYPFKAGYTKIIEADSEDDAILKLEELEIFDQDLDADEEIGDNCEFVEWHEIEVCEIKETKDV